MPCIFWNLFNIPLASFSKAFDADTIASVFVKLAALLALISFKNYWSIDERSISISIKRDIDSGWVILACLALDFLGGGGVDGLESSSRILEESAPTPCTYLSVKATDNPRSSFILEKNGH
jgi:hypothetical protein